MAQQKAGMDPGWNDPPTFTYQKATEIQGNAVKKGTLLTKRVAYPISSGGRVSSGGVDPTLPPSTNTSNIGLPPCGTPPPPTCKRTNDPANCPPSDNTQDRLQQVIDNLTAVHNLDGGDEISKRIAVMGKMWMEGKLGTSVQERLLTLSQAIKNGDLLAADDVQKSLMVDHVAVCSSWMGGIRHLINMQRDREKL